MKRCVKTALVMGVTVAAGLLATVSPASAAAAGSNAVADPAPAHGQPGAMDGSA